MYIGDHELDTETKAFYAFLNTPEYKDIRMPNGLENELTTVSWDGKNGKDMLYTIAPTSLLYLAYGSRWLYRMGYPTCHINKLESAPEYMKSYELQRNFMPLGKWAYPQEIYIEQEDGKCKTAYTQREVRTKNAVTTKEITVATLRDGCQVFLESLLVDMLQNLLPSASQDGFSIMSSDIWVVCSSEFRYQKNVRQVIAGCVCGVLD